MIAVIVTAAIAQPAGIPIGIIHGGSSGKELTWALADDIKDRAVVRARALLHPTENLRPETVAVDELSIAVSTVGALWVGVTVVILFLVE